MEEIPVWTVNSSWSVRLKANVAIESHEGADIIASREVPNEINNAFLAKTFLTRLSLIKVYLVISKILPFLHISLSLV